MQEMKSIFACSLAFLVALFLAAPIARGAQDVLVQRISGQVDYQAMSGENQESIVGQVLVQPRGYTLTRARSMAAIDLPDSSVISVGASSRVGLSFFDMLGSTPHALMTIYDGAIHFSVRHPAGAHSNYTFVTPVAQIAIRGTEGVIVTRGDEAIVACVHGMDNDTVIMYGNNQRMYVPLGATVRIRGRIGSQAVMSMHRGISGSEFDQFKPIIARNHAMRMRGITR
jgi:hypothetical protein